MVLIGEQFPNFKAQTTSGLIDFHDWQGDSWVVFLSHPNDFTPVCTTELARLTKLMPEFHRLHVKVIAMSVAPIESHREWIKDIKSYAGITEEGFPFPLIDDESRVLSIKLGMLELDQQHTTDIPLSARTVFIIDPTKKMRLSMSYPMTTGRNFDEIIRVIESLQLTDRHHVATPVDWKKGDDVIVSTSVSEIDATKIWGEKLTVVKVPSGKTYMRFIPEPKNAVTDVWTH